MKKLTDAFSSYDLSSIDQARLDILDRKLSEDDKQTLRLMAIHQVTWDKVDSYLQQLENDIEQNNNDALGQEDIEFTGSIEDSERKEDASQQREMDGELSDSDNLPYNDNPEDKE